MMNIKHLALSTLLISTMAISAGFHHKDVTSPDIADTPDSLPRQSYPFILPDSTGKWVRLTDFEGKLVVTKFWFTGCAPCIALANAMKPIIDHFEGNEDVVFVSINLDKDEKEWLHSYTNGVRFRHGEFDEHVDYVHPREVGVSTYPYGFDHPITAYYGMTGAPGHIIIEKDGEILERNPPRRPRFASPRFGKEETISEFIALIESYLGKLGSDKSTT